MFANTQMGGMSNGFPDVCLTPAPPSPSPIPIPYPNIAVGATAVPAQFKTLVMAMPMHNLATQIPLSNGDNAGVAGGVMSMRFMGPMRWMVGVTNVFVGGPPATKMLNPTGHNGTVLNVPGTSLVPSQVKVMCMR